MSISSGKVKVQFVKLQHGMDHFRAIDKVHNYLVGKAPVIYCTQKGFCDHHCLNLLHKTLSIEWLHKLIVFLFYKLWGLYNIADGSLFKNMECKENITNKTGS